MCKRDEKKHGCLRKLRKCLCWLPLAFWKVLVAFGRLLVTSWQRVKTLWPKVKTWWSKVKALPHKIKTRCKKAIAWNGWSTIQRILKFCVIVVVLILGVIVAALAIPFFVWAAYERPGGIHTEITADGALSFFGEIVSGGVFAGIIAWWQHKRENNQDLARRRKEIFPNIQIMLTHKTGNKFGVAVSHCGETDAVRVRLNNTLVIYILRCGDTKWVTLETDNRGNVACVYLPENKSDDCGDPSAFMNTTEKATHEGDKPVADAEVVVSASSDGNVPENSKSTMVDDSTKDPSADLFPAGIPYPPTLHLQYQNCDREDISQTFSHIGDGYYVASEPDYGEAKQSKANKTSHSPKPTTKKSGSGRSQKQASDKQAATPL